MQILRKIISAFLICCSLASCSLHNNTTSDNDENQVENQEHEIIFLTYTIYKSEVSPIINLNSKIKTVGKLKEPAVKQPFKLGDFACIELNALKQPLDSLAIKNPLNQQVEYVNEDGRLEKRTMSLDSAHFTVRLQLNPQTQYIAIHPITSLKTNKSLSLIKL